jgi:hypothetical protein
VGATNPTISNLKTSAKVNNPPVINGMAILIVTSFAVLSQIGRFFFFAFLRVNIYAKAIATNIVTAANIRKNRIYSFGNEPLSYILSNAKLLFMGEPKYINAIVPLTRAVIPAATPDNPLSDMNFEDRSMIDRIS